MRAMSKILIKEEVYDKVMHWVQSSAPNEVSGFGKVTINDKGEFEINEAYLIEQEVGGAHTDIDAKGLAKLMYESKDEPGQLRWWWHSHANMQVFWSGQDKATIEELGKQGWIIATVFNVKHEYRSAVCYMTSKTVKTPWGVSTSEGVELEDNVTLEIQSTRYTAETVAQWDAELAKKVRQRKYTTVSTVGTYELGMAAQPFLGELGATDRAEVLRDMEQYGAYGYGMAVEAAALGISHKRYKQWLMDESPVPSPEWKKIDERLHQLWRSGELDKLQDRMNNRGAFQT